MTKTTINASRDAAIAKIATENLGLETLQTRNSDSLDFQEQAVWALKAALEAAYEAGRVEGAGKGNHITITDKSGNDRKVFMAR